MRKIYGIPTPVCALARNDVVFFTCSNPGLLSGIFLFHKFCHQLCRPGDLLLPGDGCFPIPLLGSVEAEAGIVAAVDDLLRQLRKIGIVCRSPGKSKKKAAPEGAA